MVIEHANIIYMSDIPNVGGTSTYVLQMAKRYKDLDIAIVCKTSQPDIIAKLRQYCRVYKLKREDRIKCQAMVINHDSSIVEQVDEGKIYMTLHADYSNSMYHGGHPKFRDEIDGFITITKGIQKWLKETCGKDSEVIYNPLEIEDNKPIILMSATRMSREKGRDRTVALATALNKLGVNFIWYIFTPSVDDINVPNVIYMKPRTDLDRFMWMADYGVQLSDSEGLSYTINEFLYRNKPVIVTPLPYLEEIGIKDGVNSYIVNFNCDNVEEVAKRITKIPQFKFNHLNDSYNHIWVASKSHYEEDLKMLKRIEVLKVFDDKDKIRRKAGDIMILPTDRAEKLIDRGLAKLIEDIQEVEKAIKTEAKETPKKEPVKKKVTKIAKK